MADFTLKEIRVDLCSKERRPPFCRTKWLRNFLFVSLLLGTLPACRGANSGSINGHTVSSTEGKNSPVLIARDADIQCGADQTARWIPALQHQSLALVVNHSSRIGNRHLVDSMLSLGLNIQTIFAPEHGFRGTADAGEHLKDGRDPQSGLPVISLYGSSKKPSAAQLKGVTAVVFDIQDVGARFYTYISTLHYVLEACAEQGIPVWVFDRPNPNGNYIDGPVLEKPFQSFVGMHPIPLVHGMTIGELAQMINGEHWLANGIQAKLQVVSCSGWTHQTPYHVPVAPSPNLRTQRSIYLYPSLCLFEGTIVSVGRGTPWPFEVIGHPDFELGSFSFTPEPGPGAAHPLLEGRECSGTSFDAYTEESLHNNRKLLLGPLITYYSVLSSQHVFFLSNGFFNKLAGTDALQKQIEAGWNEDEIRASWQPALQQFKRQRKPYLLYAE